VLGERIDAQGSRIEAVLHEAKAHKNPLQLLGATLKKVRKTNPNAANAALRVMIETMAVSMPADKRQKFLNELIGFVPPNLGRLRKISAKGSCQEFSAEGSCGSGCGKVAGWID
jgi:hypothetical protein